MGSDRRKIFIDCYGRFHRRSISVVVGDQQVCFIFSEDDKADLDFAMSLFVNYHSLNYQFLRYPFNRRFCALLEPLSSHHFRKNPGLAKRYVKVFTHDYQLLEQGSPYVEMPFGTSWIAGADLQADYLKTRLISFIGGINHKDISEGRELRRLVAEMLLSDPRADCFGKGIHFIKSKLEGLAEYAFSVAMENRQQDFYFTEKVIDCFLTDTVPIYWGCPSISRFFDPRGILFFQSPEELSGIIDSLSMARYREMLPYVKKNKEKAIAEKWHSIKALYSRIAAGMLEQVPSLSPVRCRPRLVGRLAKLKNRLMR